MRLQAGTIYFVRETNMDNDGYSDLVKIGLVEDPRTDRQRLAEHQTGNPRRLDLVEGQSVKTEAVKYVESQLHKTFASKRVQGEWFRFGSETEIQEAVAQAKSLAADVALRIPTFTKAMELKNYLNEGDVKRSTEELRVLLAKIAVDKVILKRYESMTDRIRSKFAASFEDHPEALQEILKKVTVYYEPKFSVTEFKKKFGKTHAELIAQCTVTEEKFSEDFELLLSEVEITIPGDVNSHLADLDSQIEKHIKEEDFYALNNLLLQIKEEAAPLEWEVAYGEAQIKEECGVAPGIEGICTWTRVLKTSNKFDPAILANLDPDLYEQGFVTKEPSEKTIYKDYKTVK